MENLEKVLSEIFEEVKDYVDTVAKVEDALKAEFNWKIGTEHQGMHMTNYDEVEYVAESEKVSWVYALPTLNIEVIDPYDEKLEWIEVIAYYEIVETNEENLSETKVKLTGLEIY